MLGGLLLRENTPDGRTAWDVAFQTVTTNAENASAADVLLDALCLDPNAELFLRERVDLLLSDNGRLLTRLLRRFLHVASIPGRPSKLLGDILYADPSFSLYLEAQFRTPIPGRWVAVARFLSTYQGRIHAALVGNDPVYIRWRSSAFESQVHLLDVTLSEDLSALSGNPEARSTFLALLDILVAKQIPAALALQERARRLLRPDR